MSELKYGDTIFFNCGFDKHIGDILSKKTKEIGLFKKKTKTFYLVRDFDTKDIIEISEDEIWELNN